MVELCILLAIAPTTKYNTYENSIKQTSIDLNPHGAQNRVQQIGIDKQVFGDPQSWRFLERGAVFWEFW